MVSYYDYFDYFSELVKRQPGYVPKEEPSFDARESRTVADKLGRDKPEYKYNTGNQFYGNYIEWSTPKPARYVLHKDGALGSATLYRIEGVTATKVAYFYDEAEAAKAVTLLNG